MALRPLAREIVGVDVSEEMIRLAPADPQITYEVAPAEDIPLLDGHFDLVTVCGALHWLDAGLFFGEARRVLRNGGALAIYDSAFMGSMEDTPGFHTWMRRVFLTAFPMPSRPRVPMPETAERIGFRSLGKEEYRQGISLSLGALVDYLVSRSSVIAAVEGRGESIDEIRAWLSERVAPFFAGEREKNLLFGGPIWCLLKG